jgi:SAM-dependent methyltransferase
MGPKNASAPHPGHPRRPGGATAHRARGRRHARPHGDGGQRHDGCAVDPACAFVGADDDARRPGSVDGTDDFPRHGGNDGAFAVGVDLAKDAVKLAARKERRARFVTGDTRTRIPLLDGTVDAALDAFAPRKAPELARVIRPGGVVVVAIPLPGHLAELVATWGGIGLADDKRDRLVKDLETDFAVGDEHVVEHTLDLPGTATADLLLMTPHARHLGDDILERARQTTSFSTTLRALILTMTRR